MLKNILDKKCVKGNTFAILSSGAGKYVGTVDEYGCPNCRASIYFSSIKELENAPLQLRDSFENNHCNGGCGCIA